MAPKKKPEFLTDVELEFMAHLWDLGEGSVRDVMARLAEGRDLAYTSAATIMRILEQKNFVTSTKRGKTHFYRAMVAKDAYQTKTLRRLSSTLFDGAPASLVARLVNDSDLSEEALVEIRALLDGKLKDDKS